MAYYNTTNLSADELRQRWAKATKQDDRVYLIMLHLGSATASMVHERYTRVKKLAKTPLTSIRRSLNTLSKSGVVIKTDRKAEGRYGAPEHIYKINGK